MHVQRKTQSSILIRGRENLTYSYESGLLTSVKVCAKIDQTRMATSLKAKLGK